MNKERNLVVMLCGDGESSRFVFNGLAQQVRFARVIIEDPPATSAMIWWRIRHLGIAKVFGQLIFILVNRLLLFLQKRRINYLRENFSLDGSSIPGELVTRVGSVNGEEVISLLKALKPDAVIVNGTRIISSRVLNAAACPVINTHAGITPRYRGVHGAYWALANDDAKNCGVTVHLVDVGVDTGDVLYQARVYPGKEDTFNTYPLHQISAALPLLLSALRDIENGTMMRSPSAGPSKQWFHPTVCEYLWAWIRRSVR